MPEPTMKAAVIQKQGDKYTIKDDVPVPTAEGFDILLRTTAAGYCHTDSMVVNNALPMQTPYPIIGSHEPCGIIVEMDSDAANLGKFKKGDNVAAVAQYGACGECPDCEQKNTVHCQNAKGFGGITRDGAFGEYVLVDARLATVLPEGFDNATACALMCAGLTIYNGIKRCRLSKGQIIGISGLGALGHLGVQMAKAMGLIVVGIDARDAPLRMVDDLRYKPDLCINAADTSSEEAVKQITRLQPSKPFPGVDAVLVATDSPKAFQYALDITARHGLFCLVGQPEGGVNIPYKDLIFRDITVCGSLLGNVKEMEECVQLVHKHNIKCTIKTYKLEDLNTVVEDSELENRSGKAVVVF